MSNLSWAETVRRVYQRANHNCEYCQTSQFNTGQTMHVEHIIPNNGDGLDNLCLSCPNCNLSKLDATSAVDPDTKDTVSLFNPRIQDWSDHFEWLADGKLVNGLTPVGRATVARLRMNREFVVSARSRWIRAGVHPPD